MQLTKRLLYQMDGMSYASAIEAGAQVNAIARLTPYCQEGIDRFFKKGSDAHSPRLPVLDSPLPRCWAKSAKPLTGIFPILQTPFMADNKLDTKALAAQVRFCDKAGAHGVVRAATGKRVF